MPVCMCLTPHTQSQTVFWPDPLLIHPEWIYSNTFPYNTPFLLVISPFYVGLVQQLLIILYVLDTEVWADYEYDIASALKEVTILGKKRHHSSRRE